MRTRARQMSPLLFRNNALFFIATFLILLFGVVLQAHALSIEQLETDVRNDFVLGPGKTEVTLDPGDTFEKELIITNRLGRDTLFKIEIEDFIGSRTTDQTAVLLGSERGPYSLRDYLEVEQTEVVLKHGQRARIPVTINIPLDAEPGGLYGAVLLAAQPTQDQRDSEGAVRGGAKVITRLGTLFFVRVEGDVEESGFLQDFKTLGGSYFSSGPIPFQILFENDGSVHLTPYGSIQIDNILGRNVGEILIDPWFAMPDSLRLREVHWDKKFLFGRYTAKLEVKRGYNDLADEAFVVFWVIPWKLIAGVFISIVLVLLVLRWLGTNFEINVRRKL